MNGCLSPQPLGSGVRTWAEVGSALDRKGAEGAWDSSPPRPLPRIAARLGAMHHAGLMSLLLALLPLQEVPRSAHAAQMAELAGRLEVTDDAREVAALKARGELFPAAPGPAGLRAPSAIEEGRVVFGYLQSEVQVFHTRWHALTHVGSLFVSFNSSGALTGTGAFTGRSSYLKAGGAAQAAGVKVILVLNQFDDSPGGVLDAVLTSPARRSGLGISRRAPARAGSGRRSTPPAPAAAPGLCAARSRAHARAAPGHSPCARGTWGPP